MSRLIGYARVSTQEQELNLQIDALEKFGCKKSDIYLDKVSGAKTKREGLDECISVLQKGDILVVWRLDRLGRSMSHLVLLVETLREKGVAFKSICDGAIDTTTASGELIFNIFSSLAQFERKLIQERTRAGLEAARRRGISGGRPKLQSSDSKIIAVKTMHKDKNLTISDICKHLRISRASFYRYTSV